MKGRPVWIPASVGVRAQKIYQEAYEKDRRRPGFTVDGIHYALEHYGIPFLYDEPVWREIADAPLNEINPFSFMSIKPVSPKPYPSSKLLPSDDGPLPRNLNRIPGNGVRQAKEASRGREHARRSTCPSSPNDDRSTLNATLSNRG
jgi:hypothetical protein